MPSHVQGMRCLAIRNKPASRNKRNALMRLSRHFTLDEFVRSATADRFGLDNIPTVRELANLARLAQVLENVRAVLGHRPVLISSGFRAEEVNSAVGGSPSS